MKKLKKIRISLKKILNHLFTEKSLFLFSLLISCNYQVEKDLHFKKETEKKSEQTISKADLTDSFEWPNKHNYLPLLFNYGDSLGKNSKLLFYKKNPFSGIISGKTFMGESPLLFPGLHFAQSSSWEANIRNGIWQEYSVSFENPNLWLFQNYRKNGCTSSEDDIKHFQNKTVRIKIKKKEINDIKIFEFSLFVIEQSKDELVTSSSLRARASTKYLEVYERSLENFHERSLSYKTYSGIEQVLSVSSFQFCQAFTTSILHPKDYLTEKKPTETVRCDGSIEESNKYAVWRGSPSFWADNFFEWEIFDQNSNLILSNQQLK
tara:strand:+ start:328 stop:1290 length:963 start_codon:yes stop_codon:yes gene_type:complete